MKKLSVCLILSIVFLANYTDYASAYYNDFSGVWVATVFNLDYPSIPTKNVNILKSECTAILSEVQKMNIKAVFLQVRPSADSIYPSKYFPWSKYLTGKQGIAPDNKFDPLKYWVEESHKRGIELHAWINPYRITKGKQEEFNTLSKNHPANLHPDYVVVHEENYYFDPGVPQVRELIRQSVLEIVENYDVDGIHMDDYFYPGKSFSDANTFKKYGSKYSNIDDFRRDSVTSFVVMLRDSIHNVRDDISFGISPFGIWANKQNHPNGSKTSGTQSYFDHYADTLKWTKEEMIDYIAPQLYWNIGHDLSDYKTLINWWADAVSGTNTKLYIGQGAYRSQDASSDTDNVWYKTNELARQIQMNKSIKEVSGSIFFRYQSLTSVEGMAKLISDNYKTGTPHQNLSNNNLLGMQPPEDSSSLQSGVSKYTALAFWIIAPICLVLAFLSLKFILNLGRKK